MLYFGWGAPWPLPHDAAMPQYNLVVKQSHQRCGRIRIHSRACCQLPGLLESAGSPMAQFTWATVPPLRAGARLTERTGTKWYLQAAQASSAHLESVPVDLGSLRFDRCCSQGPGARTHMCIEKKKKKPLGHPGHPHSDLHASPDSTLLPPVDVTRPGMGNSQATSIFGNVSSSPWGGAA